MTDVVTPIRHSHWNHVHLGVSYGSLDSSLDFLVGLLSETDVSQTISDEDPDLESGSLTGSGHLLDWLDLHDFFLVVLGLDEFIDNLDLFDGQGEFEDLLKRSDFTLVDHSSEFGQRSPLGSLLVGSWASSLGSSLLGSSSFLGLSESFLFFHL